jgi:hypothetical protein
MLWFARWLCHLAHAPPLGERRRQAKVRERLWNVEHGFLLPLLPPPIPTFPRAGGKEFHALHEPTSIVTSAIAAKTKKVPSTSDSLKKRRAMR